MKRLARFFGVRRLAAAVCAWQLDATFADRKHEGKSKDGSKLPWGASGSKLPHSEDFVRELESLIEGSDAHAQ